MIQIRWTWALIPLVVALAAIQTCALVQRGHQVNDLRTAVEAASLRADGLAVEQRVTERQLREVLADADGLREQLAQAPRGSTPREVIRWKTRSFEVPVPAPPCADVSSSTTHEPGAIPPPPPPAPFSVRLEGTQARLETRAGTAFVVGSVDVWRSAPPPEELIATLPWETEATQVMVTSAPAHRRAGWGLGPAVGLVDGEWVYGAAATGPALGGRVALQPAAWALAGDGHWHAGGTLLVTW